MCTSEDSEPIALLEETDQMTVLLRFHVGERDAVSRLVTLRVIRAR